MINSFKINWRTHIKIIGLSYLIVLVLYDSAISIMDNFFLNKYIFYPTPFVILNVFIHILVIMIPLSIAHELIHGGLYKLYGGRVSFGYKIICAYTKETSGIAIDRTKFMIILMGPLLVISFCSLLLPKWIGGMAYLVNLIGSSGDIYMTLNLLKYSPTTKIIDRSYGYDIISADKR